MANSFQPLFYRLKRGKKLFGFGDPIGDCPILGIPLREWQEKVIAQHGCKVMDVEYKAAIMDASYFVFEEDLAFTAGFIEKLLKLSSNSTQSLQFGLEDNSFNERFVLPHTKDRSSLDFAFYFIHNRNEEVNRITVKQDLYPTYIRLPKQIIPSGTYEVYQCDTFISRMASPFHLQQFNVAANLMRAVSWKKRLPKWLNQRFSKPHAKSFHRTLKLLNRKGKGCYIHPSAVVEGCILEDGVYIGANCTLRLSHLGENTIVQDNVSIVHSVIGKNNVIANNNHVSMCLSFDEVYLIHGPYQFSTFGKSSAAFAVINCDIRLDNKTIKIPTDVGILDSNQPLLGIAYGHHSKVGGGNIIAPGRIVPNQYHLSPPDSIILDFHANK